MGRNPRNRQHRQQLGASAAGRIQHRHNNNANELLNFHFSTPAASRQDSNTRINRRGGSGSNNDHGRHHHNNNQRRRSAQTRASVRQIADSSMFYLHSSAEHTFLLTRRSPSKMNPNEYSFNGSDQSVSWESVRMVQQRVPLSDEIVCPICLCDYVCARISKCGHSFCLPCILRHVQTYAASNPYHPVKCPCCGIPIIVDDMRPVSFDIVQPVVLQQTMRLRKLHRQKVSSSPFLPVKGAPMHSSPHFAPIVGIDADARYSRFNYLDPGAYHASLVAHQGELRKEMKNIVSLGGASASAEQLYLRLAMEMVLEEQRKAHQELEDEQALIVRFAGSNTGMYQAQSPALEFHPETVEEERLVDEDSCGGLPSSLVQRCRADSVGSFKSVDTAATPCSQNEGDAGANKGVSSPPATHNQKRFARKKPRKKIYGSMYLDTENAVHLYQAEDGQLVFLNGFNMTCLLSDFSKSPSYCTEDQAKMNNSSSMNALPPLPDIIEGRILEKELVHLTSETRKRMPFLNHIPLYTDVLFVELDLNHLLSETTKQKFKNEILKRRKKRHSKVQAEKRADRVAKKEDQDRINERKARLQSVDPDDVFFHPAVKLSKEMTAAEIMTTTTEDFGPLLGGERSDSDGIVPEVAAEGSAFSFSQAARRGTAAVLLTAEAFPELSSSSAFPSLGSSSSAAATAPPKSTPWGSASSSGKTLSPSTQPRNAPGTKKKKKGEKLVLFSTGGARGL